MGSGAATRLHHVLTQADWAAARQAGRHAPAALARDGFLHCCTPAQLGFVLARHFAGATDILVLSFDPVAAGAPLRWETTEPDQPPFPHLYGPIPLKAVTGVAPP
jgi:uncharacterized protein (DUF952 family)